jgi:plastocyanin
MRSSVVVRCATGVALLAVAVACSDRATPVEVPANTLSPSDARLTTSAAERGPRKIALLDDCRASDPWSGGCTLETGSVSLAEFQAAFPRGHPAWRNHPSYMKLRTDKDVKIANEGGRPHTFTEVAAFLGGIVPMANIPGQAVAPECADAATRNATLLAPGESMRLENIAPGTHKYMCCFHPWMTAEIRVN